jgi:hypothetical protein
MLFGRTEYAAPSKFISELDENCTEQHLYEGESGSRFVSQRSNKPNFSHSLLHPEPGEATLNGQSLGRVPGSRNEAVFGIAENQTEYKTGDTIKHAEWGEGTIILIAGDVISAAFKGLGIKKIVASVAPIEKVETLDTNETD